MKILQYLSWIDVVLILLFIRILYSGIKKGFIAECFKVLAAVVGVYIAFHFYDPLSTAIGGFLPASTSLLHVVSLILLWVINLVVFRIIRQGLQVVINMEAHKNLNQWGGSVLSLFRFIVSASLLLFAMLLTNVDGVKDAVFQSHMSKKILKVAPMLYEKVHLSVVDRFFASEKFNDSYKAIITQPPVKKVQEKK